jgi:cupin 2 domain-containing protein
MSTAENLFADIPASLPEEHFATLLQAGDLRIERIVSLGHASPPGFWYDQPDHEWVLVLEGRAAIQLEGAVEPVELPPGGYLHLPAHTRHRVVATDPRGRTVWLAIHYRR